MAQAAANDMEFNLFEQMSMGTEIQSAPREEKTPSHAFVAKCIHPPSAIANYEGLPTNDTRTQVCVEWKDLRIVGDPGYAGTGTAVQPVASDSIEGYAFLILSGVLLPFICFVKVAGEWLQDVNNTRPISVYNPPSFHRDGNKYRPSYRSLTTYLNATMFNNVGVCASAQFNPAILFAGDILSLVNTDLNLAHRMMPQLIKDGLIKRYARNTKMYDIVMEQNSRLSPHARLMVDEHAGSDALHLDPNVSIQVLNMSSGETPVTSAGTSIVPTLSQIMNFSARSYAGKALEGAFNVSRLNTTSPKWLTCSNTDSSIADNRGMYYCYYWVVYPDLSEHFVPFRYTGDAVTPVGQTIAKDSLWSEDMTWSWVVYDGLVPNLVTSASSANASSQLIIAKSYIGFEVQPAPRSAWAGLQRLGPKPDLMAMQSLMDAFYELKDCMPARYNFWGTLASVASQGLKTFGSGLLKELVRGKFGQQKPKVAVQKTKEKAVVKNDKKVVKEDNRLIQTIESLVAEIHSMKKMNSGNNNNNNQNNNNNNNQKKKKNKNNNNNKNKK